MMHFDGEIPLMLYDATVLRKAKQEELDRRLNMKTNDPLVNLRIAKYTNLSEIICSLELNPFYCMYCIGRKNNKYYTNCIINKLILISPLMQLAVWQRG